MFKVGDRVRVVKNTAGRMYDKYVGKSGTIFIILDVSIRRNKYVNGVRFEDGDNSVFSDEELSDCRIEDFNELLNKYYGIQD